MEIDALNPKSEIHIFDFLYFVPSSYASNFRKLCFIGNLQLHTLKYRKNEQGGQIFSLLPEKTWIGGQIFRLLHEKVQAERLKTPKTINEHALLLDTWEYVLDSMTSVVEYGLRV